MNPCKTHRAVSWIFQTIAAVILLQTLFFKFTGAAESRYIFSTLGAEPWGRLITAFLELGASGLLLRERRAVLGALVTGGLMTGAIAAHLTRLGVVVLNDGGQLFALAVTAWGSSLIVLWLRRTEIPYVGSLLAVSRITAGARDCPAVTTERPHRKPRGSIA